jgi:threonine/homoserine/homoserine lactone efflux protein
MPNSDQIMDWFWLIASGISFGIIAAAPIGAVNIICIRRTLHYGPINGFVSGLGAALGDAFFAALVVFGFTSLSDFIRGNSSLLEFSGGVILIGYAIYALVTRPPVRQMEMHGACADEDRSTGLIGAMVSTLGLTLINPATFFFFAAVAATLSNLLPSDAPLYAAAGMFVAAVLLGSSIWWAIIVGITYFAHQRIGDRSITVINRVTGILIGLFGVAVLANLFFGPWV